MLFGGGGGRSQGQRLQIRSHCNSGDNSHRKYSSGYGTKATRTVQSRTRTQCSGDAAACEAEIMAASESAIAVA
eukprot:1299727-Prymnesium_polylepis.1